jgi:hypothetical protein
VRRMSAHVHGAARCTERRGVQSGEVYRAARCIVTRSLQPARDEPGAFVDALPQGALSTLVLWRRHQSHTGLIRLREQLALLILAAN